LDEKKVIFTEVGDRKGNFDPPRFPVHLWSCNVTQATKKTLLSSLIACLAVLFCSAGIAAGADDSQSKNVFQPQGLEQTGIYALREMDPNLTGAGVKFAVISRSYTYIDDEPQNDYRPDISHNSFKTSLFGFKDQVKLPAGTSPHSTAIC